jgi:hypothetical protein
MMGGGRIFIKTFSASLFNEDLISARSISLDSTLKEVGNEKEGGSEGGKK